MNGLYCVALAAVMACSGCVTSGDVREQTTQLQTRLDADKNASRRCAPKAEAFARAQLDVAGRASERGESILAAEALASAGRWTNKATEPGMLTKCGVEQAPPPADIKAEDLVPGPLPRVELDRDKDGILDGVDACPDEPEDIDGYLDDDGCPDVDNDGDGISDAVDQCPIEPEDIDGVEDIDGCPER